MPTANQILGLIKSHAEGDEDRFHALTLQLAASEERKGHRKIAEELRELADRALKARESAVPSEKPVPLIRPRGELAAVMSASYPKTRLSHIVLPRPIAEQLAQIVHEQRQRWKLREHGLAPRHKLLLVGPPGSGKTLTATALAGELGLPLFSVLLHGLITKFMGETAAKLRLVFDAIAQTRGVYLFDELDAIGARRAADNDVGEARRILNSFLQFLEEDESESLIIATTNHRDLLDPALFRRFHLLVEFRLPDKGLIIETMKARLSTFDTGNVDWNVTADAAIGLSNADVTRAAEDAARLAVLEDKPALDTRRLITAVLERRSSVIGEANARTAKSSPSRGSDARRSGKVSAKGRPRQL
jgi:SpoVK/Ycf46/Vps4 family AAA+-type ATPase